MYIKWSVWHKHVDKGVMWSTRIVRTEFPSLGLIRRVWVDEDNRAIATGYFTK